MFSKNYKLADYYTLHVQTGIERREGEKAEKLFCRNLFAPKWEMEID